MATKKIILDFKQQPIANKGFQYKIYINGTILTYANSLNYLSLNYKVGTNISPFYIGIGTDLDDTIDKTLAFLTSANYIFTGFVGGYSVEISYARVGDKIEISITSSATIDLIYVWEMISDYDYVSFQTETPCSTIFLTNQSSVNAQPVFDEVSGDYSLKNFDLNTSKSVTIPNRFDCEMPRDYSYGLQSGGATLVTIGYRNSLSPINVNAYFNQNDLYVDILNDAGFLLGLLYSIDGTAYQSEPLFTDLATGQYTLYIKDVYGCQKTFLVTNNGETNGNFPTPYILVSESNSLRFIRRIDWGNCSNYKNVYNTLSCEENVPVANKYLQLFQSCDTIVTQVKTSYENVEVATSDGTEITATKIVRNIQISDKRDCIYYTYNGSLAVLFLEGDIYDYDTTDVIGTYELNGLLPDYGVVGNWVETPYGTLQIVNIRLADNGERSLILNASINIVDTLNSTIQTIYNRENYDIWEFTLAMADFLDLTFNVGIKFYQTVVDENFPDVYYISEMIQVKTRHARSVEVNWYNSKNTDIYFFSGIQMKNRLNLAFVATQVSDGEVDIQKTDLDVVAIDATNYQGVEFQALNLTTGMVRKIILALKHDNLVIEGVAYKLAENPEYERLGESNFYRLTAKLLEAGDVWNSGAISSQNIFGGTTELIGLLEGDADSEYIRTR